MKSYFIFIVVFCGMAYSQCNDYSSNECNSNDNCNWVEVIESGYCENHNSATSCPISPACSWSCQGGWYLGQCVGWYACTGGYYQQDNSYCEEVEVIECSEMNQLECINNNCNWVEDFQIENCYGIAWNENDCESIQGCNWWTSSYYGTSNCAGSYQIDNSYCEENLVTNCSDMNEFNCNNDISCDWIENIEYGSCNLNSSLECSNDENCSWVESYEWESCSSLGTGNSSFCDAQPQCSYSWLTYSCGGGSYQVDNSFCSGGVYEIDSSYCEEVLFEQGDINGDFTINILDIIDMVNLILNEEWNFIADMNYDHNINVLDIIIAVDIILGN